MLCSMPLWSHLKFHFILIMCNINFFIWFILWRHCMILLDWSIVIIAWRFILLFSDTLFCHVVDQWKSISVWLFWHCTTFIWVNRLAKHLKMFQNTFSFSLKLFFFLNLKLFLYFLTNLLDVSNWCIWCLMRFHLIYVYLWFN